MENKKELVEKVARMLVNDIYKNRKFTSMLYEMFSHRNEAIEKYIKVGREFWCYDVETRCYRKLKVTYVRSGVMFFSFEDEPEIERAWFISSFLCGSLHAAQIYPYEIGSILSTWNEGADVDFPEMCKTIEWDDCDGKIKVEVIWDNPENE